MHPMLPIDVHPVDFVKFCRDDNYSASQKCDGIRMLSVIDGETVSTLNRNAQLLRAVEIKPEIINALRTLRGAVATLDGEYVAGVYYVFDLPQVGDVITPRESYKTRRAALETLFAQWRPPSCIRLLPTHCGTKAKTEFMIRSLTNGSEGVMFNNLHAAYQPGPRRTTALYRAKFVKEIDCVVTALNIDSKANMQLAVYDDHGQLQIVGECTALAGDGPKVVVGDVVTVKYLYAVNRDRPRLVQPTLPRLRADKAAHECVISQLRFTNREVSA